MKVGIYYVFYFGNKYKIEFKKYKFKKEYKKKNIIYIK